MHLQWESQRAMGLYSIKALLDKCKMGKAKINQVEVVIVPHDLLAKKTELYTEY